MNYLIIIIGLYCVCVTLLHIFTGATCTLATLMRTIFTNYLQKFIWTIKLFGMYFQWWEAKTGLAIWRVPSFAWLLTAPTIIRINRVYNKERRQSINKRFNASAVRGESEESRGIILWATPSWKSPSAKSAALHSLSFAMAKQKTTVRMQQ